MSTFIALCPWPKLSFHTTSILSNINLTFHQINNHFWITIIIVVNSIHLKYLLLNLHESFILLHKWLGGLFPLHGLDMPISSISSNCDLTKWSLKFLLFLKSINEALGNNFLCLSKYRMESHLIGYFIVTFLIIDFLKKCISGNSSDWKYFLAYYSLTAATV